MSGPIQPGSGALTLTGHAPTVTLGPVLDVHVLGRKGGHAAPAWRRVRLSIRHRRRGRALRVSCDAGARAAWSGRAICTLLPAEPARRVSAVGHPGRLRATAGRHRSFGARRRRVGLHRPRHGDAAGAANTPLDEFDVAGVLHGDNTQGAFRRARASTRARRSRAPCPSFSPRGGVGAAARPGQDLDAHGPLHRQGFRRQDALPRLQRVLLHAPHRARRRVSGGQDDHVRRRAVLLVERFDVDENGVPLRGVEDLCGLLGLPPNEKYSPSTEQVVRRRARISRASAGRERPAPARLILSTYVVRNADCHAKNIALMYTGAGDVEFTPAYDMVTRRPTRSTRRTRRR